MIAALLVLAAASSDYASIDADDRHQKFGVTVVSTNEASPAVIELTQTSPFAIGSGPIEDPRPNSVPVVVIWHGPHGDTKLACTSPVPAFSLKGDQKFHLHLACDKQPGDNKREVISTIQPNRMEDPK